ncbi:MAG TPA: type II toxin-antitoxin system VapC family toxin [Candidatus Korarchaeota archaeon]|nr:type II toxin-antitoxin system VapC family toxin [Candidatus Korarchaeota archaeon]
MKIVVDSYAWIELFIGSDEGDVVKEKLSEAEEIYTPDIVLAELARKYRRERVDAQIIAERLSKIVELSRIVPIDKKVAVKAAEMDLELREEARKKGLGIPGLFDAIVLAVTHIIGAKLITGDEHFRGRPEVIWIGA